MKATMNEIRLKSYAEITEQVHLRNLGCVVTCDFHLWLLSQLVELNRSSSQQQANIFQGEEP